MWLLACISHRFVNFGFTVKSGAHLVFDMPKTKFGPNSTVGKADNGYDNLRVVAFAASISFRKVDITRLETN